MKNALLIIFYAIVCNTAFPQVHEWVVQFGGPNSEPSPYMAIDQQGNTVVVSTFTGEVDFDPGPDSLMVTAAGNDVFIVKLAPNGSLIWMRQIEDVRHGFDAKVAISKSGNIFVMGSFRGSTDFDPGPGITTLNAGFELNVFILKLTASGDFAWVRKLVDNSCSWDTKGYSIAVDKQESIFVAGTYACLADFDPGFGTVLLPQPAGGGTDFFLAKLNASGNLLWVKGGGGTLNDVALNVATDTTGNAYLSGRYFLTVDFDPGPGVYNVTANGGGYFLLKLDLSGNFVWVATTDFNSANHAYTTIDTLGNSYVVGEFSGNVDFDPGSGVVTLSSPSWASYSPFILKLSPSGELKWAKKLDSDGRALDVEVDELGYVYAVGYFNDSIDMDPGIAVDQRISNGGSEGFMVKLDSMGNYVLGQTLGGDMGDQANAIRILNANNIYITGLFSDTVDFNPGNGVSNKTSNGFSDVYVLKWKQDSCSQLAVVIDSVRDVSCLNSGHVSGAAYGGESPYLYTWNTSPFTPDSVAIIDSIGIYTLNVTDGLGCHKTASFLIGGPTYVNTFDMGINLIGDDFRPGFISSIELNAYNLGCLDTSGQIQVVVDSLFPLDSTSISPDFVMGDTLLWDYSSLTTDSTNYLISLHGRTSLSANIGEQVCFDLLITPTVGDIDTTDNQKTYCFDIINSYDPNDKQVYPIGECEEGLIASDQTLTYTVQFQNTGNANAINIFIIDSLDSDLDLNSVKIVGQSHEPMITEVLPGNALKFRFDNIHLPDSTTNEPASHGYLIFEVNSMPGLPSGTQVKNQAEIYFDFNDPILTNVVSNVVVDMLPEWEATVDQIGLVLLATDLVGATYQWIDCTMNEPIIGATQRGFLPDSNGFYAVVISSNSCTKSSTCYSYTLVGLEETGIEGLKCFPNPSKGMVSIQLGDYFREVVVEVWSPDGRKIKMIQENHVQDLEVLLPELQGMYLLRIEADGNQVSRLINRQ